MALPPLWPHQRRALDYARPLGRAALFMEMRLGKSRVAIQWSLSRKHRRVLLLLPLSATADWIDELTRHGIRPTPLYHQKPDVRAELAYGGPGWYLLNYEMLRRDHDTAALPWDAVIADESTRFRNPKAQITKDMNRVFWHVPEAMILTGLPNPESELDYFEQMRFLHGSFCGFRNFWAFRNAKFHEQEWQWWPDPGTREMIKEEVHRRAFVLTRKQAGLKETAVFKTRVVQMSDRQRKIYKDIFRNFAYEEMQTNFATVRDVWLARVAGGYAPGTDVEPGELLSTNKGDEIAELLKTDLRGQQVVILFRFNQELEGIWFMLRQAGYRVERITGATSVADRKTIQAQFRSGRVQILCAQVAVMKYGIDLSAASTCIYYSNSYEYETRSQSQDRIIHVDKIKRKEPVLYIDLITDGTLDRAVVTALKEKGMNARLFQQRMVTILTEEWKRHGQGPHRKAGARATAQAESQGGPKTSRTSAATTSRPTATRVFPRAEAVRHR